MIKEHSGSNLPQLADEIRGEAVQRKMRAEVRERVLKARGMGPMGRMGQMGPMKKGCCEGCGKALTREGGTTNDEEIGELGATFSRKCWEVWRALKATRKEPEFSREIWALGYGFATYRRMYRACKVVYEMTPQQLEMSLIEEALRKTRENEGKDGEWDVFYAKWKGLKKEFKEWTPEELDKASRSIKTWDAIEAEAREKRNSKCKMENAK
ncbi:MAG TPA: hypothetical protein VKX17_14610 [Planctomycetota bacterium]|nr:hypothetical protein [Planctomycetota bacterium]